MHRQSRAHRILLDIAHAREQMPARVHGRGVVGFFPERFLLTVSRDEMLRVARRKCRHQARGTVGAHGRKQQVHVIAHQRIGVHRAVLALRAFAQRLEIGGAVWRAGKAGAALASALHDVQRGVGFFRAGKARHGKPNNAASRGAVDSARRR